MLEGSKQCRMIEIELRCEKKTELRNITKQVADEASLAFALSSINYFLR